MENLLIIVFSAIFVNNYVLARFLGICPFLGVSKDTKSAFGMGIAVTFVMVLASVITWPLQTYVLNHYGIGFLQTVVFILVIASLVQFVEIVLQKTIPTLHKSLGIFLPLITTNCAILGVALININESYSFVASIVNGAAAGVGFILALLLMSGIRERLELENVPHALKGVPIALITAALMSIAFLAFSGMV